VKVFRIYTDETETKPGRTEAIVRACEVCRALLMRKYGYSNARGPAF